MLVKKRLAALLLALALVFSYTQAGAYTYYDISKIVGSDDYRHCADSSGGIYLSGLVGTSLELMYINGSGASSFSFEPDGLKLEAFSGCRGIAGAVFSGTDVRENGVMLSQLQILTYDYNSNFSDVNTISATIGGDDCFALGRDKYYIIQDDHRTIRAYSLGGVFLFSVYSAYPVYQLIYDSAADCLYAAYDCGIYLLDGKTLFDLGDIKTPVSLSGKSALTSSSGKVYTVNGRTMNYLCTVPVNSCAVVNNRVYYSSGSTLYSASSSGELISSLDVGGYIFCVFPCGTRVAAMTDTSELLIVEPNEMNALTKPTVPNQSNASSSDNGTKTSSVTQGTGTISSSVYDIDETNRVITGIKCGTTIAVFKSNIDYDGYGVSFRNYDGNTRTSGNVGTGFTAEFSGADTKSYTLIVSGDLTGEGNINSLDVRKYMQWLCGKTELASPFMTAFDINSDGLCDALDLLIAAKK